MSRIMETKTGRIYSILTRGAALTGSFNLQLAVFSQSRRKQRAGRRMHTVASNRVSARERELAPRYYYKVAEKTSCGQKIRRFVQVWRYLSIQPTFVNKSMQVLVTFMFTQVGVIVLIASYMVGGAFVFQHIEQDSLMEQALTAQDVSSY